MLNTNSLMSGKVIVGSLVGMLVVAGASKIRIRTELGVKDIQRPAPVTANVPSIPANADPCVWIAVADVTRLLGKLADTPHRGLNAANTEPAQNGRACVYTLDRTEPGATGLEEVGVEVVGEDAMSHEASFNNANALAERIMAGVGEGDATQSKAAAAKPADGWDYTTWFPNEYFGRIGHVGVLVHFSTHGAPVTSLPADSVERLAVLIRDHVPDLPIMSPRAKQYGGGDDPCRLLTRAEAEGVLGKLAAAPYRSNGESALVDPSGEGCSYYLGKHRAFTLKPEWENGKTLFRVSAGTSAMFSSAAGAKLASADTLDGPWDQAAAGIDGMLYFLKGDRMVSMVYRTANIDATQALRLASIAVRHLAEK